jgi:thiol-disulfide isomerase/thioredoxin
MKMNDIFTWVKKQCSDDEICIMLVFVVVGFMLCWLFKDQISGFTGAPLEVAFKTLADDSSSKQVPIKPSPKVTRSENGQKPIGIELKPRKPDPTPSTEKQLQVMAGKPVVPQPSVKAQVPGLQIQDSMIFLPFDEVWNPGFMPLDMVFKESQGKAQPSLLGLDRPMGPDRPMKPVETAQVPRAAKVQPSDGDLKLVLLYAPWCGHSKKMLPDYEKVKSEFDGQIVNGKKISVVMYNSDVDKDKVKEYEVRGFPTLFVETNGDRKPFPHRTYDKISEYIKGA